MKLISCAQRLMSVVMPIVWLSVGVVPSVSLADAQAARLEPLVVGSDLGGFLKARYLEIEDLYATGREVQILGPKCLSSCTLFLGLDNVCVGRDVQFGFHGPTYAGVFPYGKERFEYLTTTMAGFYPEPIRRWFLDEARHTLTGFKYITGQYVISLGYRECSPQAGQPRGS